MSESYNPGGASTRPVWALPRSLATTWGIILIFSSCGYLDVSVPRVRPLTRRVARSLVPGCPIRKSPDQWLFAPPRSLSQLITSFIASESQGIPHALLVTFSNFLLVYLFSEPPVPKDGSSHVKLVSASMSMNSLFPFGNWWLSRKQILNNLYIRTRMILQIPKEGFEVALLRRCLSRKEVFQPHLPVRLPCYDLAPVNSFTLGRSLRVQTSGTTIFHGLTGGVYKARERIHRVMADARLLANPTSRSRVPDSDPD